MTIPGSFPCIEDGPVSLCPKLSYSWCSMKLLYSSFPDNLEIPLNSINEEDIIRSCILRLEAGELEWNIVICKNPFVVGWLSRLTRGNVEIWHNSHSNYKTNLGNSIQMSQILVFKTKWPNILSETHKPNYLYPSISSPLCWN